MSHRGERHVACISRGGAPDVDALGVEVEPERGHQVLPADGGGDTAQTRVGHSQGRPVPLNQISLSLPVGITFRLRPIERAGVIEGGRGAVQAGPGPLDEPDHEVQCPLGSDVAELRTNRGR